MPSLSAKGQNLLELFNNLSCNIKFGKKYSLRQPTFGFKISQGAPEENSIE